ncbi:putative protein TPRXL [Aplysia californica]|uniref:Uncharacterized protein n=1 Tax=Aplysia californica TaxID=6500 RepID=A0ABM0K6V8_APLCA|nr:putative protein TPRXL [Aplysia californica]
MKSLSSAAVYSSNPEIRVSSPRGRSASPVIGHRRREYSPHHLSNPSPPMMAMNLVKTSSSSSSSSSSSAAAAAVGSSSPSSSSPPSSFSPALNNNNNSSSIHSISHPSPLPSPVPRSTPPSSSSPSAYDNNNSSNTNNNNNSSSGLTSSSSSSSAPTSRSLTSSSAPPSKPKPSPITLGVPPLGAGPGGGSSPLTPISSGGVPIISPSAKHPMTAFHGLPTPLFLPSPMVPVHFWSSLSPVTTLSPRLNSSASAFQFPSFFNGPLAYSPLVGTFSASSSSGVENLGTPGLVSTPTRTIPVL